MDTPDTDPHRPRCLEDMAGASDWMRLRAMLTRADPPNIVLAGGAGTGKSCALRLTLGSTITMWLRCSQDPTLRDSRDRIKAAARRRVAGVGANWIVLEHADLLHADAQAFLRRIIETSTGACRFVLEVRDVAAVAEPLLSRTILFVAPQLVSHEIRTEVMRRAPAISRELAERIAGQSGGNVRWAVLQGLGGGDGMIAEEMPPVGTVTSWTDVLAAMEALQRTGTAPKAWLGTPAALAPVSDERGGDIPWERAGGACPWSLTAYALANKMAAVR